MNENLIRDKDKMLLLDTHKAYIYNNYLQHHTILTTYIDKDFHIVYYNVYNNNI